MSPGRDPQIFCRGLASASPAPACGRGWVITVPVIVGFQGLRAMIDPIHRDPFEPELAVHLVVDQGELLEGQNPLPDRRLVRDRDQSKPGLPASLRSDSGDARDQPDFGRIGQVVDVLDDRAVPVEENRRSYRFSTPRSISLKPAISPASMLASCRRATPCRSDHVPSDRDPRTRRPGRRPSPRPGRSNRARRYEPSALASASTSSGIPAT